MKIHIQPITAHDAEAACSVVRTSIAECCFADHQGDAQVIRTWLANKTPENFRAWFSSPPAYPLGAFDGGQLVGVALVSDLTLSLCYVIPERLHRAVGTSLLATAESLLRGRGIEALHLESTRTAEAFYRRNGFQPSGPVQRWAGLQALPMSKRLAPDPPLIASLAVQVSSSVDAQPHDATIAIHERCIQPSRWCAQASAAKAASPRRTPPINIAKISLRLTG